MLKYKLFDNKFKLWRQLQLFETQVLLFFINRVYGKNKKKNMKWSDL
jgi:hypothetical protein